MGQNPEHTETGTVALRATLAKGLWGQKHEFLCVTSLKIGGMPFSLFCRTSEVFAAKAPGVTFATYRPRAPETTRTLAGSSSSPHTHAILADIGILPNASPNHVWEFLLQWLTALLCGKVLQKQKSGNVDCVQDARLKLCWWC